MIDDRVYKRGAIALHAVRRTIGDGAFFDLLRGWTTDFRHRLATTDDFRRAVERAGGVDAVIVLSRWIDVEALPPRP